MAKSPTKSPTKSQNRKPKVHAVPQIYGCYLLRSIPKQQSFYIGSTPDPVRNQRLRQHNGHLTAGAYRTKREGTRPWEMVLYVYGFPSKISALMFEHAWQHCYSTRHIPSQLRISTSKTAGRTLAHKVGNVRLLLRAPFFSHMALKVQCFNTEVYKVWCDNKFGVAVSDSVPVDYDDEKKPDAEVNMGHVVEFKKRVVDEDEKMVTKAGDLLTFGAIPCGVCSGEIDYMGDNMFPLMALCPHCEAITHLSCLASRFKEQDDDKMAQSQLLASQKLKRKKKTDKENTMEKVEEIPQNTLIPRKGKCAKCEKVMIWSSVVKTSTRVRAKFGFTLEEDEDDAPIVD